MRRLVLTLKPGSPEARERLGSPGGPRHPPQLRALGIAGPEKQRPVDLRSREAAAAAGARAEVRDLARAGRGAVARPQLLPVLPVVGLEVERPARSPG